jgi:hypothetical protein
MTRISYTVPRDFGSISIEMNDKGVVSVGEIALDTEIFGMPFSLVVKKPNY